MQNYRKDLAKRDNSILKIEETKNAAIDLLRTLCARCKDEEEHFCPVRRISNEIEEIKGVPIIVNSKLYHVMFN